MYRLLCCKAGWGIDKKINQTMKGSEQVRDNGKGSLEPAL